MKAISASMQRKYSIQTGIRKVDLPHYVPVGFNVLLLVPEQTKQT